MRVAPEPVERGHRQLYLIHLGAADAMPLDPAMLIDPTEHSEIAGGLDTNAMIWLICQIDGGRYSKVWAYGKE